eukprot:11162247-Lingulodinium_polyedra.AAC.1
MLEHQQRSVFNLVAVKQLTVACNELSWVGLVPDICELVEGHQKTVLGTQVVEDLIGTAKDFPGVKGCKKYRRPQKVWAVCISKAVLDKRHKYDSFTCDQPLPYSGVEFDHSTMKPTMKKASISLNEVESTDKKPHWFSPAAVLKDIPVADLVCHERLDKENKLHLIDKCWMGKMLSAVHQ